MISQQFVLKRKKELFVTGIFPARNLFFITVSNKFQKLAAWENYSHFSFILIPKQHACNCNDLVEDGNPTSLPSRELERDAHGQKQAKKTEQNPPGQGEESPGTARQDRQRAGHQRSNTFHF